MTQILLLKQVATELIMMSLIALLALVLVMYFTVKIPLRVMLHKLGLIENLTYLQLDIKLLECGLLGNN
ncbi:MAG: hypothetical protein DRI37_08575 [Chloroflexi bacterium]|nr:MAG: hypothetical protein DRI37_08575 [Chloroflexota bacterium]